MSAECQICELYSLIDGWLSEAKTIGNGMDQSTRDALTECATDLVEKLPPRGHAFHRYNLGGV